MMLLLGAVVQGAWGQITFPIVYDDVWDGHSETRPIFYANYGGIKDVVVINTAAELAYVAKHWDDDSGEGVSPNWDTNSKDYYEHNYYLNANLNMGDENTKWKPLGFDSKGYIGHFYGNNHTVRIVITGSDGTENSNEQGFFAILTQWGFVSDLHVTGKISLKNARKVGGIAGILKNGNIENCWVSADISTNHYNTSTDADLGGIVGVAAIAHSVEPVVKYCCMTGNVSNPKNYAVGGIAGFLRVANNVTFYGTRTNNHKEDNLWVGDLRESGEYFSNGHSEEDLANDDNLNTYLSSFSGNDLYRQAIQFPFAVNVSVGSGYGRMTADLERTRPGKTVTLKADYGTVQSISVKDADGNNVSVNGNAASGYTFTMPKRDVNVTVTFEKETGAWSENGDGTESSPYTIANAEQWNHFAGDVNGGTDYSGKYIQLAADIITTRSVGLHADRPFSGTFIGNGHTLTADISSDATGNDMNAQGVAPFHYIKNATIKGLTVAGTIKSASYHTAGIVGFAEGTNLIEGCTVTAKLLIGNNYAGGIIGHGMSSSTTIKNCVFTGSVEGYSVNGVDGDWNNVGGIWGWNESGCNPVLIGCVEAGTYINIDTMHPIGLQGDAGSVTDCYYLNDQKGDDYVGYPENACTLGGSAKLTTTVPENEICTPWIKDGQTYYIPCHISGKDVYEYTGNNITIEDPVITAAGKTLEKGTDYTYSINPATVQQMGNYAVTISGKGNYSGTKTVNIYVVDKDIPAYYGTLNQGKYLINVDETLDKRLTINGNVLLHLAEGATLHAKKGIELGKGSTLTIEGKGALLIDGCDANKSGIGAATMGELIVNGGQLTVNGGEGAAGIGTDNGVISGKLTLGWSAETDFIQCSSYSVSSFNFAKGKQFLLDGTTTIVTTQNISGKIVPYTKVDGVGTAESPYVINNDEDWKLFASDVNGGNDYSGKTVKLMADITVSQKVGTVAGSTPDKAFSGTFLGNGHTLDIHIYDRNRGTAPFCYIKNATIKDLTVKGVVSGGVHAAALVGFAGGTADEAGNTIENCKVAATIYGVSYTGGIVGHALGSNTTIKDCVYSGKILASSDCTKGVFLGWGDKEGTKIMTNCLYLMAGKQSTGKLDLARTSGNVTATRCYKTTEAGGYGTLVSATKPAEGICKQVTAADGNTYYMRCSVSDVQEGYQYTGSSINITAPTVTAADGTPLTAGQDFTCTTYPETVSAIADYTLTVSGTGTCSGSESFSFAVAGDIPVTSSTTTLGEKSYKVYDDDVTVNERITVSGNATLYLGEGATLRALKGFELASGNSLTIDGPGTLIIDDCADGKSGIGAATAGTLTIQGGQIEIQGGKNAAGIGSDTGAASGNLTIGWQEASDYMECSSYATNVTFGTGKSFVIDDDQIIATTGNIGGKRIVPAIMIEDKGDNGNTLTDNNGKGITAALNGRTLYLDDKWNTLCLPFDYNINALKEVSAYQLTEAGVNGTTLNLKFEEVTDKLKAGVPYIIKFSADTYALNGNQHLVGPVFSGVTIDNKLNNCVFGTGNNQVSFIGTYSSHTFAAEDKSILLMGGENKLYYPADGAFIGACRAYFKIGDGTSAPRIDGFNISFDGDDSTLGVTTPLSDKREAGDEAWYSLDGRRLQGKPAQKGVYINNGKKIVIK